MTQHNSRTLSTALAQLALTVGMLAAVCAQAAAQSACVTGRGTACASSALCQQFDDATLCVDGTCQAPCMSPTDPTQADPDACSLGETCTAGFVPGQGTRHYCRAASFSMDLNLLDSCIYHFVEGLQPDLTPGNQCDLGKQLSTLLDRDSTGGFDIYDVDLCIRAFLGEDACNTATQSCADNQAFCNTDATCGQGLYCDPVLHRCSRECGFITNRGAQGLDDALERQCSGSMQVCDYTRGKCVTPSEAASTCSTNDECPVGAYCFIGECVPRCYRSLDCPDSNWYCSSTNLCQPRPKPGATQAFNPKDYTIQFTQSRVSMNPINDRYAIPLVIMNQRDKREVFGQPNVVFGYRLELKFGRKQTDACVGDLAALSPTQQEDCIISPNEEFITLDNPFGTLYGDGQETMDVHLNDRAIDLLTPGFYSASLTAIFSNGTSTSTAIVFNKPTMNGEYAGRVSIVLAPQGSTPQTSDLLGNSTMAVQIYADTSAAQIQWDTLLSQNSMLVEREYQDINQGYPVTGYLHGTEGVVFDNPNALTQTANQIPMKGIYSPAYGRMRMIGVVELPANYCVAETGACATAGATELRLSNPFARPIRRIIELIGQFDAQTNRFDGVYRETFSGLAPTDVTLDGGFILDQTEQKDTPVTLGPLLASSTSIGFPTNALTLVNTDVSTYCISAAQTTASNSFVSQAAFNAFMASFDAAGGVLENAITFENRIEGALNAMVPGSQTGRLTLADYFRGQITFCSPTVTTNCISQNDLRCGLALQRKAILSGWVNFADAEVPTAAPPLFCSARPGTNSVCPSPAAQAPGLVAMQEHNRFYRELTQTYTYQAGAEASDAFYTMYKSRNGDALGQSTAWAYKEARLRAALANYDSIIREAVSVPATAILFAWPARSFQTQGSVLLSQLHTVLDDRLDATLGLYDLRRRLLVNTDDQDYVFVKHLLHIEYLNQVYLATLEKEWEGELLSYAGEGRKALEKASSLLSKVSSTRNPIGLHSNRIFFENSNETINNWENYRARVLAELPALESSVDTAITSMRNALTDRDSFEGNLLSTTQQLNAQLDELCGAPAVLAPECNVDEETKQLALECQGPDCLYEWVCDGEECDAVVRAFTTATSGTISEVACRADTRTFAVELGSGSERTCVHGRLGALLQERAQIDLQRKHTVREVQSLLRAIGREQQHLLDTQTAHTEMVTYLEAHGEEVQDLEVAIAAAEFTYDAATLAAEGGDCWLIAGLAAGTNCPQRIIATVAQGVALATKFAALRPLTLAKDALERASQIQFENAQADAQLRDLRRNLDSMMTDVERMVAAYELATLQLYNVDTQVLDVHYQAQRVADRYGETVTDLAGRLIGRESGSVIERNAMVQDAEARFQDALIDVYKMSQAFIHRYNIASEARELQAMAYQISTVQDIRNFVEQLNGREASYCGRLGADCDAINNNSVLRISLRQTLFPNLRDIVDPETGTVLTAGEQFHNLITSSAFVKRRLRASGRIESQVELPFSIWLNDRFSDGTSPQPAMADLGQCNHIIASDRASSAPGTIRVDFEGANLRKPITEEQPMFELWRGATDYMRSCSDRDSRSEPRIYSQIAGYSNESTYGQLDEAPSFVTRLTASEACANGNIPPGEADCWFYFARDRSLGASDWTFTVPGFETTGTQAWLVGDGVTQRPQIDDIVLYVRHTSWPVIP